MSWIYPVSFRMDQYKGQVNVECPAMIRTLAQSLLLTSQSLAEHRRDSASLDAVKCRRVAAPAMAIRVSSRCETLFFHRDCLPVTSVMLFRDVICGGLSGQNRWPCRSVAPGSCPAAAQFCLTGSDQPKGCPLCLLVFNSSVLDRCSSGRNCLLPDEVGKTLCYQLTRFVTPVIDQVSGINL